MTKYGKPDAETPEWTREDSKHARPAEEVFPEAFGPVRRRLATVQVDVSNRRRARGPQKAPKKQLISIRLSPDVVVAYRKTGRGWQARIDTDLRHMISAKPADRRPKPVAAAKKPRRAIRLQD